jgi:hypothetical protein
MNAAIAKPIPYVLVYSGGGVDPDQTRAAARGRFAAMTARPLVEDA